MHFQIFKFSNFQINKMEKKHWQSFGELNQSEAYNKDTKDEFREDLPFVADESKGFLDAKAPRRDFLKYLGFSTAAAAAAASCEMPVKKAIPFANKPEDIVPGVSKYYATTYVQDGDVVSVLAKVRDGRPIKIEGNNMDPFNGGGTSARVQASVLDLYDTARLRFPTIGGQEVTFEAIDKSVAGALTGPVVVLTSSITSPTTKEIINAFIAKYPGSRHVTYDAISYSGLLLANQASYGQKAIPSYHFENAKAIVSIGADFLGTWLSPVEFSRQYATGKKLDEQKPEMSKHIHFETIATLTGSNADEKYLHRPSETGAIVAALYKAISGEAVSGISDEKLKAGITKAAKALTENKGAALVVCGSNDVSVQILVNAINSAIGANGTTIDWNTTVNYRQGDDGEFVKLVEDMNAGAVGSILIHGANPAYTWFEADKFKAGLAKVKTSISFSGKVDETAELCKYVIPDHHFLESWGDAEPKTGYFSFIQPTIFPLFKTRQWQDSLLKWSGNTSDYLAYLKNYWSAKTGGETGWDKVLQDGVINPAAPAAGGAVFNGSGVEGALIAVSNAKKGGKTELVIYEKVAIGATGASNPWLQEMPDPVTRATWDNYVIISPALARTLLDIDLNHNGQADDYEVNPPKKVVKVTVGGKTIELPSLIIPGTHPDTIGIAVGYGRSKNIGKSADGFGKNAFPLLSLAGNTISFTHGDVTIATTGETYPVALTQTHSRYDTTQGNRTEVVKEITLAEYKAHPAEIREEREAELKPWGGLEKFESKGTMYPVYDRPGIKWGMSIDLNSCTGCGACVVACTAENNVAVVGKPEVLRGHEMQWLRIDRYYSGDMDNPNVVFQPMLCQHCDNAPCENVCPVAATNHSSEGVNQMIYNRCIGTRYCANNCPFKVRRFNWADYSGADSFPDNMGHLSDVVHNMNDDLTRMVLNPDVTVRSRGVIEKCSFCVQRTQEAKLTAKKDSRPLVDSDIKTACQQACASGAITFGNANDTKSAISQIRKNNPNRQFYVLEQLHVLPNVTYLAKVRNQDEEAHAGGAEHKAEEKKEAPAHH
jgi:MoCo/4Fe-4S cofactor protein with predicted Tat translocation signal